MKSLIQKYKHAWVLLYAFIYFPWFFYLEKTVTKDFSLIQTTADKAIPLVEYFIIPYYFWFAYVCITVIYFFFKDKYEFYRLALFLIIGMTAFLIISTLWPNGHTLRPTTFERDNIFVDMVKSLYLVDTPTNVFPSIHVYNSIACHVAIQSSVHLKKHRLVRYLSLITCVLIILSTIFLKQHSYIDAIGAGIFAIVVYVFVYANETKNSHSLSRLPV